MDKNILIKHKEYFEELNNSYEYDLNNKIVKSGLRSIINNLNYEIKSLEYIENQPKLVDISNKYSKEDSYVIQEGDIQYVLPHYIEDKDGSFHLFANVYIPNENGYINLTVCLLGRDKLKNRIYTSSCYYKTNLDWTYYYSKSYGKNYRFPSKFKEYVKFVLDEFNKLPEINNQFKIEGLDRD